MTMCTRATATDSRRHAVTLASVSEHCQWLV